MTISARFAIVPSAGVTACARACARIEKTSKTLDSRQNRRRDDADDGRSGLRDRRRASSQKNASGDVPLWNGPRLRAPFVAQILGQNCAAQAPDARSVLASYTQIEAFPPLLDRSV